MLSKQGNLNNLVMTMGSRVGFVELVAIAAGKGPIKATRFVDLADSSAVDQVIEFCGEYESCDLYYGNQVRCRIPERKSNKGPLRSTADDVEVVTEFVADIDAKDHGNDMQKVEELLAKVPFRPFYKLYSGHGIQARWKLDQPLNVTSPGNLKRYDDLSRRLVAFTGADSTQSREHLYRVPGSINRKDPAAPVQTVAEWNVNREPVSLEQWDELLPPVPVKKANQSFDIEFSGEIPEIPWDKLPDWFLKMQTKPDRSGQDFKACCIMLRLGLTFEEIYAVYQQRNNLTARYHEQAEKGRGDEYLKRTLNAALNELGGLVPVLILPRIQAVAEGTLDSDGTAQLISDCLRCDERHWSALLWQVRKRSSLDDKAFQELIENQLANMLGATSINQEAPNLELPYLADVPRGFAIHQGRIYKLNPSVKITEGGVRIYLGARILGYTAVVVNRQVDESRRHYFELAHDARGGRETLVVPSSSVFRTTDISKLTDWGLDISSNDATDAVEYFKRFVDENQRNMPVLKRITCMGWHGQGFVYGDDVIEMGDCVLPDQDGGESLLVQALSTRKGTLERQVCMVKRAIEHPGLALGIYAAFAAPLLTLWDQQGFLVDFAGTSSVGKSTTLQVVASLWGQADKRGTAINVIHSWKGTYPGHERYLQFMQHLPAFFDETKTMIKDERSREIVIDVAYSVGNGMGKTRGKIQGTQAPSTWRTVALSTGEQPLSMLSHDSGLQARVIQVWGTPFKANVNRDTVDWFDRESTENCGRMGRRYVGFLVENLAKVMEARQQLSGVKGRYFQTSDPIGGRQADYFAVMVLAGRLVHEAFPELGAFDVQVLSELFHSTIGTHSAKTPGYIALELLENLVGSEPEAFKRGSRSNVIKGRVQNLERDKLRYVAIIPAIFDEYMRRFSLDPHAVVLEWRKNGWLDVDPTRASEQDRWKCGDTKMYRLKIQNLPQEFQDSFRDPLFWDETEDASLEKAQAIERDRSGAVGEIQN